MPTSVIHEIVGKKLTNKYKKLDNYNFYLGNIAPDSVNINGFAPKEERWFAHLRDKDLNIWKENIIDFYNTNKDKYEESFFIGYITHIMTDIIYDELFYDKVVKPMKKINLEGHEAHLYMLDEMNAYGINNVEYNEVLNCLKKNNNYYDIRNINKKIMEEWKLKIINQVLPSIKVEFITEEIINSLEYSVEKELIKNKIL